MKIQIKRLQSLLVSVTVFALLCGCQQWSSPFSSTAPENIVPVDLTFTCRSYYGGILEPDQLTVRIVGELWPQSAGGVKVQIDLSDRCRWTVPNGGGSYFRKDWEETPLPYIVFQDYLIDSSDDSTDPALCVFCPEKGFFYLVLVGYPSTYLLGSVDPEVPEEEILDYFSEFFRIYHMGNRT